MEPGQIAVIVIVAIVGVAILQAVLRSLGKVLRWAISTGAMVAGVFLLWKVGALDWADTAISGLGA